LLLPCGCDNVQLKARLARAICPGHPHHVAQCSNGRAWVLMPHHVHPILVPAHLGRLRLDRGAV